MMENLLSLPFLFAAGRAETLANSSVLSAAVTGIFAVVGTATVYTLSKRKPKKYTKNNEKHQDKLTYIGYETLIGELKKELGRLYDVANDRETLIDTLRRKENELYKIIEGKNQEISQLRHLREYSEAAAKIPRATMHNNTKAQSEESADASQV